MSHSMPRIADMLAPLLLASAMSCGGMLGSHSKSNALDRARSEANDDDADSLGRLLLTELTARGGTTANARAARARLDRAFVRGHRGGLEASLARAIDD